VYSRSIGSKDSIHKIAENRLMRRRVDYFDTTSRHGGLKTGDSNFLGGGRVVDSATEADNIEAAFQAMKLR
jgi:hypothetical protein